MSDRAAYLQEQATKRVGELLDRAKECREYADISTVYEQTQCVTWLIKGQECLEAALRILNGDKEDDTLEIDRRYQDTELGSD